MHGRAAVVVRGRMRCGKARHGGFGFGETWQGRLGAFGLVPSRSGLAWPDKAGSRGMARGGRIWLGGFRRDTAVAASDGEVRPVTTRLGSLGVFRYGMMRPVLADQRESRQALAVEARRETASSGVVRFVWARRVGAVWARLGVSVHGSKCRDTGCSGMASHSWLGQTRAGQTTQGAAGQRGSAAR